MDELVADTNRAVRQMNVDDIVADFNTYEDYLDSQITSVDLFYLEDRDLARQLVELGYRGHGEPLKRQEYEAKKKQLLAQQNPAQISQSHSKSSNEASASKDQQRAQVGKESTLPLWMQPKALNTPFLKQLQEREELIRQGKLASIAFVRMNKFNGVTDDLAPVQMQIQLQQKGQPGRELSGYIDLSDRLLHESFQKYYDCKSLFMPRWSDMSCYDWDSNRCVINETTFFQVLTEKSKGMAFRHKRDRKVVRVDPSMAAEVLSETGESVRRVVVKSPEYLQVVFYDHLIRRKS